MSAETSAPFSVSFADCSGVELTVGVAVGSVIGPAVGLAVGLAVGSVIGPAVGLAVGLAVGSVIGPAVGLVVGLAVGLAVGVGVTSAICEMCIRDSPDPFILTSLPSKASAETVTGLPL